MSNMNADTLDKLDSFRAELAELLAKYDASIDHECVGDTSDISNAEMTVCFNNPKKINGDSYFLTWGYSIEAKDLRR